MRWGAMLHFFVCVVRESLNVLSVFSLKKYTQPGGIKWLSPYRSVGDRSFFSVEG